MDNNEQLFTDTFENAGVGIALVATDGKPYRVNRAFSRMLGYSEEELKHLSFDRFTHPQDATKDLALFEELKAGKIDRYSMEKRYITKGKEIIWVILNVSMGFDQETQEPYAIAIVQDITERVKAETELEQRNEQLDHFAYLSSHDLQQPLSNIEGFLNLLIEQSQELLDEECKQYLALIDRSSKQLKQKLQAILTFSRLGSSQDKRKVNPKAIIEKEWAKLSDLRLQKNAVLHIDTLDNVEVYQDEFELLIYHLLKNALIFSSDGRISEIKITMLRLEHSIQFKIIDNGRGIHPSYFERVFQIFQQLHEKSSYDGLGVGLSYCKKIVEHHGGKIWIESTPGTECIINFTIPYKL